MTLPKMLLDARKGVRDPNTGEEILTSLRRAQDEWCVLVLDGREYQLAVRFVGESRGDPFFLHWVTKRGDSLRVSARSLSAIRFPPPESAAE